MKKQLIRLTENDLNNIIKECVKKTLNESFGSVGEIQKAYDMLNNVTKSGFIPFASPAPSSTEKEIKNAVIEAMRLLDKALYLSTKMGYNESKAHVV